jgi:hypothetical protein
MSQNSGGVAMFSFLRQSLSLLLLFTLGVVPMLPQSAAPPDHVISPPDLRQALRAAAETRNGNIAKIAKFLSTEAASKALQTAKLDRTHVTQAVSIMSDQELSRLAALTDKVQSDVVAGELAHAQLWKYIIVAAATSILIWVIVTHRAT